MLPAALSAQEHIEADIGADIVSGYIWRGQDLGNISIQPSASISYKGIWLSGWGTVGFDKDDTKEFDLTVGYSIKGFSASITDYWFDGGAGYFHYGARNGFEIANISLAATKTLDITESYSLPVSAKAIWNPATEGAYFVFGINF